jgi:hypothetical protein
MSLRPPPYKEVEEHDVENLERYSVDDTSLVEGLYDDPDNIKRVPRHLSRDRLFQLNGIMYAIEMESAVKSNQITLFKLVGGKEYPMARYGMKYGSAWFVGSVLAINSVEVDEVLGILACLVAV